MLCRAGGRVSVVGTKSGVGDSVRVLRGRSKVREGAVQGR